MAQSPSRKDTFSAPKPGRNVTDLAAIVRHQGSYLRSLDPGMLGGRFGIVQPVRPSGGASELVGGSDDGDEASDEILFLNTDQFAIDGPGDKVFLLTYVPIQEGGTSLHVRWVPIDVPPNNWSCVDNVLRVSDPGWLAGDLVTVAYAYLYDGDPEPSDVIVPFGSDGWKWLQVPFHDPGDYSDPLYDDSAWATAAAPFGTTDPAHTVVPVFEHDWLDYATVWEQNTQMWARRDVDAEPGVAILLSTRLNRTLSIWWNGSYRGKTTAAEFTWTIPAELVLASNVLVCKVADDSWAGHYTGCYFDVEIAQELEEA